MFSKILILITLITLFTVTTYVEADELDNLDKAITYAEKISGIGEYNKYKHHKQRQKDRGTTLRNLNKYGSVGYRPVITILPIGTQMFVGPVIVSHDRRYVRLGVQPFFSHVGNVSTFIFRR